ncbi:short-chain dehydrogenase, partial [Hyaloraphidium curvatum]
TGVSRGIGFGIAKALLEQHGANLVGIARTETAELGELKKLGGSRFHHVQGDVTDLSVVKKAVADSVDRFGALDSVILNAGVLTPLLQLRDSGSEDVIKQYMEGYNINVVSNVALIAAAVPHLLPSKLPGGPRVLFVSSGAAERAISGWGMYCSSKAAQWSLCMQLHKEEPEIMSVAIRPGIVESHMQKTIRSDVGKAGMPDSEREFFLKVKEDGKLGDPLVVGAGIAKIALTCPKEAAGKLLDWSDKVFG